MSAHGCCQHKLADIKNFSNVAKKNGARACVHVRNIPEIRCFSDSMILVTGLRWTEKVWNSCGPDPTVSGCWTMTRTDPELVPYAISIQFPLSPDRLWREMTYLNLTLVLLVMLVVQGGRAVNRAYLFLGWGRHWELWWHPQSGPDTAQSPADHCPSSSEETSAHLTISKNLHWLSLIKWLRDPAALLCHSIDITDSDSWFLKFFKYVSSAKVDIGTRVIL